MSAPDEPSEDVRPPEDSADAAAADAEPPAATDVASRPDSATGSEVKEEEGGAEAEAETDEPAAATSPASPPSPPTADAAADADAADATDTAASPTPASPPDDESAPAPADAADDATAAAAAAADAAAAASEHSGSPPQSPAAGEEEREEHDDTATVSAAPGTEAAPNAAQAAEDLVRLVYAGDVAAVAATLEALEPGERAQACSVSVARRRIVAPPLLHAVYAHRKRLVAMLLDVTADEVVRRSALFFAVRYCKYDVALFLVARRRGEDVNHQRAEDGDSILHRVCAKPKPPIAFIAELCKLRILRVNQRNHAGYAPVHLLALHSTGVEGREACLALRAKGALLDAPCDVPGGGGGGGGRSGATPLQLTRNAYLREALGLAQAERRRGNPLLLLPAAEVAALDELPVSKLPKLKHIEVGRMGGGGAGGSGVQGDAPEASPGAAAAAGGGGRGVPRRRRLHADEESEMVNRLYTLAKARQTELAGTLTKRFLEGTDRRGRRLNTAEQDESVDRLFSGQREHSDRFAALCTKYVQPMETRQLPREHVQESVQRLYRTSVERSKDKHDALFSKYMPQSLVRTKCGGKTLSREESTQCSKRLHDECVTKQKETLGRLRARYLPDEKSRVLTREEMKQTAERLHGK